MKKILTLVLVLVMVFSLCPSAFAVNEDVEFPNLVPGNEGSFFFYGGTSSLITKIYGEMETGTLDCDMMLVAEPAFSLELKEAGYLEPVEIESPDELLRFPYDEEGYWYPVRVCNMVLAYNPEMVDDWAAKARDISPWATP